MNQEQIQIINALKTVTECKELEDKAKSQGNLILAKAAHERMFELSINNLKNEKECESFAKNAKKLNRPDLVKAVNRKSIDLFLKIYPGYSELREVETECLKAVYAYEKILHSKNRKRIRATYTWRSIKDHGIIGGIDRIVSKSAETIGFNHLSEIELTDYSFEAIVLKYPDSFTGKALNQAQKRMGIEVH